MKRSESATYRSIVYIISTIFVQGSSVIFSPVYTRILSTSEYGYNSVYLSVVNVVSIICGLQTYGTLLVKKNELSDNEYRTYCTSILGLSTLGYFISLLFIYAIGDLFTNMLSVNKEYLILMVSHAFGLYCVNFIYAYLTASQNATIYLIISVLLTLSVFFLCVIFVTFTRDSSKHLAMYWGNALPYIITGIVIWCWFMLPKKHVFTAKYWRSCFDYSFPLIFHNLAAVFLVQADRIMLKELVNAEFAGIYSLCYSMALPVSALWSSMNNAWKTDYFAKLKIGDMSYIELHSKRYLKTYTLACMGFLMIFPEFVKIMASEEYWIGISFMPVVILSCYFIFLYSFPANFEFAMKKTKGLSIITVIGAAINILLNYYLIPVTGMTGAAVATLAAQVLIFVAHDIVARISIKNYHYKWSFYIEGIIPVAIMFVFSYILFDYCIIRWIIAVLIGLYALRMIITNKALF